MTDDIPDDVVERALDEFDADWRLGSSTLPDAMRAALRVAVEWEREQCARIADADTQGNGDEYDYSDIGKVVAAKNIAAAIRSRKD